MSKINFNEKFNLKSNITNEKHMKDIIITNICNLS